MLEVVPLVAVLLAVELLRGAVSILATHCSMFDLGKFCLKYLRRLQ
jgi:hypothetical protein